MVFAPTPQSTDQPWRKRHQTSDISLLGGHLTPTLTPPLRSPPSPPRAEGRAGADNMSHALGLELRREAPPLLGPLLSPFPLPLVPGTTRCCAAITDSPSPIRLGKGPHGGSDQHRRCRGERPGGSRLDRFQPGWGQAWCHVRRLAGGASAGAAVGGEEEGEARAGCEAESCRERGGGRPFPRNFRGSSYSAL